LHTSVIFPSSDRHIIHYESHPDKKVIDKNDNPEGCLADQK